MEHSVSICCCSRAPGTTLLSHFPSQPLFISTTIVTTLLPSDDDKFFSKGITLTPRSIAGNNHYIPASDVDIYSKSTPLWQNSLSQSSSDSNTRPTPPVTPKQGIVSNPPQNRRNMGGRKPAKEPHLSPEEEERRRIRRERNKAAAARCRKRRVDHTNSLIEVSNVIKRTVKFNQIRVKESVSGLPVVWACTNVICSC